MQMPVFWLKLLSWHKAVKITGGDSNLYFWAALVCWVCNPCWALSIPQEQHGRAEGGQGMGASQHWLPSIAPPLPVQLPFSFVLLLSYLFLEFESMLRVCHALLRHSNRHVCFVQKETAQCFIWWFVGYADFSLFCTTLLCANLTIQLNNDGGAATFPLLGVELAPLRGAKYAKGGYQSGTAFPV